MYKVNEERLIKNKLLGDLCVAYSIFEYDYKDKLDLEMYLKFFEQVYICLNTSNFNTEEMILLYIGRYDSFDKNLLNILFLIFKNVSRKYGIRMERINDESTIFIQFTKKINSKDYYVDDLSDLKRIENSIA